MADQEKKIRTNIILTQEFKAKLDALAKEQNRSFNNFVITVLQEYVKRAEEGR
jgi:predicted HicB family RNase H-like nuclease